MTPSPGPTSTSTSTSSTSAARHKALRLLLPTLQRWCLAHVQTTAHFVAALQASANQLPLLSSACAAASAAADSVLYMALLSWVALSLDHAMARKMALMWCVAVYVANYMQDALMLPRPFQVSGSVVLLEVRQGERYGLPCVKTLSATCLPFYFVVLIRQREDAEMIIPVVFSFAASWCFIVGFSRMDLGRNTPADVIAGHLLGHLMIGTWILIGDQIDEMLVRPFSMLPWLIPVIFALCLMAYPVPTNGSPSFTETAVVLGWGAGWAVASCWFLVPTSMPVTAAFEQGVAPAVLRACIGAVGVISTYSCVVRFFDLAVPPLACFSPVASDARRAVTQALQGQMSYGGASGAGVSPAVGVPTNASVGPSGILSDGTVGPAAGASTSAAMNTSSSGKKSSRGAVGTSAKAWWWNFSSSSISKRWVAAGYEKAVPVLFLSFMCAGFSASFSTPILLTGMGLM